MFLFKLTRTFFSFPGVDYPLIRRLLLYLAGLCLTLNTTQAAVVLPAIDSPTPWKINTCLDSWYSPNAGYWAAWCRIVEKGTWYSRGYGFNGCINTSPVTEQNMLERIRDFAIYYAGDRNCETRATWTGWMAPGGRIRSPHCWTIPYTEKNGIEVLNGGWIRLNGNKGDNCAGRWGLSYMVGRDRKVVSGCPNGYELRGNQCILTGLSDEKNNGAEQCENFQGNPVNVGTGNNFERHEDYRGGGPFPLRFERAYNSDVSVTSTAMGRHWRHNYARAIKILKPGAVKLLRADGRAYMAVLSKGQWRTDADITDRLSMLSDARGQRAGWRLTTSDNLTERYDAAGRLISITTLSGQTQTLDYNLTAAAGGDDNPATLDKVSDAAGRSLSFTYDNNQRLRTMTDPAGGVYRYSHAANGNLSSVTYPNATPEDKRDNPRRRYHYEDPNFPHALTGVTDENNTRFARWGYDSKGRAVFSEHAGGAGRVDIRYNTDGSRTVTDALGRRQTYRFQIIEGVKRLAGIDGDACLACTRQARRTTYDAKGFVTSRTGFNGNITNYRYNARGLETARTEAAGTPSARTRATEWHPRLRLPVKITVDGKETALSYDSKGRLLRRTETDTATLQTRTTTHSYYSAADFGGVQGDPRVGLLKSTDGPRTDVRDLTTYAYDRQGNLTETVNALGHARRVLAHDAHGRALTLRDANGTLTELGYDARGRLLSLSLAGYTTRFEYDRAGRRVKTTRPDGAQWRYEYDEAGRLRAVEDGLGRRIEYTLDRRGNRVREDIKDEAGRITRSLKRVYSRYNRLVKTTGGAGQTRLFEYDANGNLTQWVLDPEGLNRWTRQVFDRHNRLTYRIDAEGGKTAYAYDARDNLTRVTDAGGRSTVYTYDGFDNLIRRDSPATGVTRYGYDAAGNRVQETDARGVTGRFRYDALNRLTERRWPYETGPLSARDIVYRYDTGPGCGYGLGRLCQIRDESGVTGYRYDRRGLRLGQTVTRDGRRHTTSYAYDGAGQRRRMTYPSGRRVRYERNRAGEIERVTTRYGGHTQTLVRRIRYRPFGPVSAIDYGNGLGRRLEYDPGGRLRRLVTGPDVQDMRYEYDPADNLTARYDLLRPAQGRAYDYDDLNRLTGASGGGLRNYTYDAPGNRLSRQTPERHERYRYDAGSGRLWQRRQGATTRTYGYDASGNTTEDGRQTYRYGAHGRLAEVRRARTGQRLGAYRYNALGERVKKMSAGLTYYHYDLDGRLLAETDALGETQVEYLYLGGEPLALGRSGQLYYYHNDHLGTPQKLTDGAQNVVWSAAYEPFGEAVIETGYISQNLRFPGQYYDEESGLHYNLNRYYEPKLGRYLTSDPIGLAGGLNTYVYALNNPLYWIDPLGLTVSCSYNQATGQLICIDNDTYRQTVNEQCYSGAPGAVNDPSQQNVPNVGPIPRGDYNIETGVGNRGTGPQSLPLTPTSKNKQFPSTRDPGSFLIHGDNSQGNQSASQGCIICTRSTRNTINNAGGGSLQVY